jgi:superfamily II DNA or RNA helicase/HKD family nuclease
MNIKLDQTLQAGFVNQKLPSFGEYLPQLLVNDKEAGKKVLASLLHELNNCEEFWFSVAFVTTSGVATLIETLIALEKRGIKGKILVSQYLNFTQPEALRRLLQFKNLEIKIAVEHEFHSKGYLFKKNGIYNLIIGSSNLTASALCSNIEWNLKISATPISHIIFNAIKEFTLQYEKGVFVDDAFINDYEILFNKQVDYSKLLIQELESTGQSKIVPNSMQLEALSNILDLRNQGKIKALLISATGTGKTFLSAFDVKKFNPKKFLFVVHRLNIAAASMRAYKMIFGNSKSMGLYSGFQREMDAEFIFSTVQTISREEHLKQFDPTLFDYIVIDETHRAGAETYSKILNYFRPKFLLGMTATPERTDGLDVFKLFDYNIAYEIRLHRALDENMLSPFHYYGVTDITVGGKILDENSEFKLLTSAERINRVIEKASIYGCDNGKVRGLIFCSSVEEAKELSNGFNLRGFKTMALSGENGEGERTSAIAKLESESNELDYIFTVDIFNEGIDIPSVNQIIMLRPTQSAIVFVQQLGRGLRKIDNKDYLTVIDFIGNYKNNFLVPIALYGDTSYNKDTLRKLMSSGSSLIPGTSTINFDLISREKIFAAIDAANMQMKKDLVNDYKLLKFRLGRIPFMVDFFVKRSRDPQTFVNYSKSYFNFVTTQEEGLREKISQSHSNLLELFSSEIANAKRIEEIIIMKLLVDKKSVSIEEITNLIYKNYGIQSSIFTIESSIRNLNFEFVKKPKNIVSKTGGNLILSKEFISMLNNNEFTTYFIDLLNFSEIKYNTQFSQQKFFDGFILYQKYSRKEVCRILNWEQNEESTVYGYRIKNGTCPIFVNYHKEENIAASTKFEDEFINNNLFQWFTKPRRNLESSDVRAIRDTENPLRISLFIKKSNGESDDFYYMGDVKPVYDSFELTSILDDHQNQVSVVKIQLSMNHPVEDSLYQYLTKNNTEIAIPNNDYSGEIVKDILDTFKIVPLGEINPFSNCIPLYDIKAAAGNFSELQHNEDPIWVKLNKPFQYSDDFFICKAIGESMNKVIPNNSWCLFKKDSGGSKNGKIVLVHQRNIQESEFGNGYTIKLYESQKNVTDENWEHESIILKPQSHSNDFKELILTKDELIDFKVDGIFVSILFNEYEI